MNNNALKVDTTLWEQISINSESDRSIYFNTSPILSISPKGVIKFEESVHKNNLDETALEFIKIVEKMSVDRQHNSIIIESYSNENDVRCMSSGNNIRITYGDIAISSEDERSKNKNLKKCLLELCERL